MNVFIFVSISDFDLVYGVVVDKYVAKIDSFGR